jgi:hypothetical protein
MLGIWVYCTRKYSGKYSTLGSMVAKKQRAKFSSKVVPVQKSVRKTVEPVQKKALVNKIPHKRPVFSPTDASEKQSITESTQPDDKSVANIVKEEETTVSTEGLLRPTSPRNDKVKRCGECISGHFSSETCSDSDSYILREECVLCAGRSWKWRTMRPKGCPGFTTYLPALKNRNFDWKCMRTVMIIRSFVCL